MTGRKENPLAGSQPAQGAFRTAHTAENTAISDTEQALGFIWKHTGRWPSDWYIQIAAIEPDGPISTMAVPTAEIDSLAHFIKSHQGQGLYFCVNPLRRDPGKKASRADVAALACCHIDLDMPKVEFSPEEHAASKAALLAAVDAFKVGPSTVVDTGNGLGVFWELREPVSGDAEGLEVANKQLAAYFGADTCSSIEHLMRLPGTTNYPNAKKRALGRAVAPTKLLSSNDQAYSLNDFEFLPAVTAKAAVAVDIDPSSVDEKALRARLTAVQSYPDLKLLLEGKSPLWASDTSGSGRDFDLAKVLDQFHFMPAEIFVCLRNYSYGKGAGRTADYLNRTISKVCAPKEKVDPGSPLKPAPGATGHGFEAPYLDALWDDNLAIDWMISGVLENKVIAEIWGPAGAYKSFAAFDMAVAIASGQEWHGHKVKCQGPVLYVCGEGGRRNIIRRLRVVCQERGLGRDQKIRVTNMPVLLSKAEQYEFLREEIAKFDIPPVLIIIDTLARNFGGNENSAEEMGAFLDNLGKLSREFEATILIIHHCGYDGTHSRGSYALHAGIDNEYKAVADKTNKTLILKNEKMKDAEDGKSFYFNVKVVELKNETTGEVMHDDEGNPITSIVLHTSNSQYAAARDAFFKNHPVFKSKGQSKIEKRLPLVLGQAHFHPECSDRQMAQAVDSTVADHSWASTIRALMLSEGLTEGEHFKLTAEGEQAVIAFNSQVQLVEGFHEVAKQIPPVKK